MVKRTALLGLILPVLAACSPANGPRFYNAAPHDLSVSVTYSDGRTGPFLTMKTASFFVSGEALQVMAIEVNRDGKPLFRLSGDTLPRVPAALATPYKQMWEITDSGVCVLPESDFHGDTYPKCPEPLASGGAAIS